MTSDQHRHDAATRWSLLGLTTVTGVVDAVSFLGLGHIFTANMTGNVVFLGFAIKLLEVKIIGQMRERSADSSGVHVWLVLMKAHRSLVRHAERSIVSLDMCISDFGVLEVLLHKGPQSVSEIGRRVDLTSGSITTAIDRLEQRGLVARAAHASDRRARVVHTPAGKARITQVFSTHKEAMGRAAHGLSKAERGTLIELLKKLGMTAERQLTEGDRNHDNHPV